MQSMKSKRIKLPKPSIIIVARNLLVTEKVELLICCVAYVMDYTAYYKEGELKPN